jgi:hypothetical protein
VIAVWTCGDLHGALGGSMKKRKSKRAGGAKVRTPVEDLTEEETMVHYNAIQLEDIRATMKLILETTSATLTQQQRQIDDFKATMHLVLEGTNAAIVHLQRQFEEFRIEIKKEFDTIGYAMRRMEEKIDRHGIILAEHEARIGTLETL